MPERVVAHFHESYKILENGVTTSLQTLVAGQKSIGTRPLIVSGAPEAKHFFEGNGTEVLYVKGTSVERLYPKTFVSNLSLNKILDFCGKRRVSLVHIHVPSTNGLNGLYVQKILKVPCVSTFHTMWDEYTSYFFGKRIDRFFRRPIRSSAWLLIRSFHSHCDATIAPSVFVKQELERRGIENVFLVPTGIDTKRFRPSSREEISRAKRKFRIPGDKKVILYLGRMGFEKNLPFLLKTLESTENSVLVFGGKGPALEPTRELARKRGLLDKVIFAGFVPDRDLRSFYGIADVFAMPSHTETQGLTVLEAMACGKPVVAFRGATSEFVGDAGVVARTDSEFIDGVGKLVLSSSAGKIGRLGRKIAEKNSPRKMALQIDEVYCKAREIFRKTQMGKGDFWTSLVRRVKGYESLEETFRRASELGNR